MTPFVAPPKAPQAVRSPTHDPIGRGLGIALALSAVIWFGLFLAGKAVLA